MSRYYGYGGGWAPYVPVAERRRKAEREVEKLRRKGQSIAPVTIEGRQIATTFWGKAWCRNLENYRDFEYRLPRGRSCVRNGLVLDLQITRGKITALISGSEIYRVAINITEIADAKWKIICADCSTGIDNLVDLLQGRFIKGSMERLCQQDAGLFPKPQEIRLSCTCPDHAALCKHIAAALYGVGSRLDHTPELLFQLRGVEAGDLIAQVETSIPFSSTKVAADKVLAAADLSALFGLDIAEQSVAPPESPQRQRKPKSPAPKNSVPAVKENQITVPNTSVAPTSTLIVDVFIPPATPEPPVEPIATLIQKAGKPLRKPRANNRLRNRKSAQTKTRT